MGYKTRKNVDLKISYRRRKIWKMTKLRTVFMNYAILKKLIQNLKNFQVPTRDLDKSNL